jgi:hypothetical protein
LSKPACPGSGNSAPGCKDLSRILARAFLAALVVVLLSTTISPAEAQEAVDATLVLAVDVSGSIDSREFVLQRQGYAKALTDKRFLNAVKGGEHGAIAVGYFEWTGPGMAAPVYECTVI